MMHRVKLTHQNSTYILFSPSLKKHYYATVHICYDNPKYFFAGRKLTKRLSLVIPGEQISL